MDVRTNLAPSPVGGTAADVNKDQDINDDHHPRTLCKKEPNDATKSNTQSTRYNIQKAKNSKGRKSKGQHHGGAEKNSKVGANKLPERGSVLAQKGKKENGNHLLNFSYGRDSVGDVGGLSKRTGNRRKNNKSSSSMQQHKYNKDQFVQYSCQFVVSAGGDYSIHLTDPNILVDWKLIEQIKFYSSEDLSCPICLYAPVAARITSCGHIYCWPCVLRYFHIENNNIFKCSICSHYVHKNDLKSVIVITQRPLEVGDVVTLRLMRREKHSLFVMPADPAIPPPTTFLSVSENANNEIYSKLLIASEKDIADIIERERVELEDERQKNSEMLDYIVQALGELSHKEEKLGCKSVESKSTSPMENAREEVEKTLQNNEKNNCKSEKNCNNKSLPKQSSIDSASSCSERSSSPSEYYYFYQAEDGQHVYLHTINVRMLRMQHKELKNCPPVLTGKLLEKESSICSKKFLGHLPSNSPWESAEIELKPPFVSKHVVDHFRGELSTRRDQRERKKREEKKRARKIKEEENRLIGIYPTPNIDIESFQDFPEWQPEQLFKDSAASSSESASSSIIDSPPAHSSAPSYEATIALDEITLKRETDSSQEQGPSFASILTGTRNKPVDPWPSVKSKYSNPVNTSSNKNGEITMKKTLNKSTTAWPSVKSDACSKTASPSSNEDKKETHAHEQDLQFPEMGRNKSPEPEARDDDATAIGKRGKKKKVRGTVLYTTHGMGYPY